MFPSSLGNIRSAHTPPPSYAVSTPAAARRSCCSGVGLVVASAVLIPPLDFLPSLLLPSFFVCLRRTGLVSYPAWLGQRIVPYLGGNYVTRFLLAKRYLSGVGDLEGFRWVPQPVRPAFSVIANQMHFLGPGSQFVGSEPRFLVLTG